MAFDIVAEEVHANAVAEIRRRWGWDVEEFARHAADPEWYESGGVHIAMVLGLVWND